MKVKKFLASLLITTAVLNITACSDAGNGSVADTTSKSEISATQTPDSKPETTKNSGTITTKSPESVATEDSEATTSKAPETTVTKAPETTTSTAPESEPPSSDTNNNAVIFANLSTGESYNLFNDTAIYTQSDGWASIALGGHDVEGAQGCSILGEVILDGVLCASGSSYTIYDSYKPPSFLVHLASDNGPVTIDDANYPDNFGNSLVYIEYVEPLKEITFTLDITFVGGDGNTYRISGKGSAPFTAGAEPPQRIYDETCIVCNGTGKCRGCNGTGWFSTVGDGIRCNSCYSYSGICIGCDGYGKH